jgi:glutathione S-transferase
VTIELYHNGMSTCSQKVRVTLAEKGQDFISHHFNLRAGDQHAPEYLAINPNGVVPTIIHDGKVVYESAVVDEYLDDIFPDPPLRSADPYERARMRLWVMEGKTEAQLKKTLDGYVDPVKRERMTENVLAGVESRFFKPAIGRIVKMVDDMQASLSEGTWMASNSYSLADIAFAPYVTRVAHLQQDWLFDTRPRVADWLERMRARPAYQKGMVEWFNPDFLSLMELKGGENKGGVKSVLEAA